MNQTHHHASVVCQRVHRRVRMFRRVTVVIAPGKRPVPFRTRKLSLVAPMVLQSKDCGRVGHRRTKIEHRKPRNPGRDHTSPRAPGFSVFPDHPHPHTECTHPRITCTHLRAECTHKPAVRGHVTRTRVQSAHTHVQATRTRVQPAYTCERMTARSMGVWIQGRASRRTGMPVWRNGGKGYLMALPACH